MRLLFAIPSYRQLFSAQVMALLANGLLTVALGLLAYRISDGHAGLVLGVLFGIKMVAFVLVAPLSSALFANVSRTRVLVGADLVRIAVAFTLPFITQFWEIVVLMALLQSAAATFTPAFTATIPLVVKDEGAYTQALSLSRLASDLEAILAPLVASALLTLLPFSSLFVATALGFMASAGCVLCANLSPTLTSHEHTTIPTNQSLWARSVSGAKAYVANPALRPILAIDMVIAASGAFILVQTVVIAQTHLGLGEGTVGLFLAANGLGSTLLALALPVVLVRIGERSTMIGGTIVCTVAMGMAAMVLYQPVVEGQTAIWIGAIWLLHGIGWSAAQTPIGRIIRRQAGPGQLTEFFAARFSLSHGCWLIAYPLAGTLGAFGLAPAAFMLMGVSAAFTILATLLWTPAMAYQSQRSSESDLHMVDIPGDPEIEYATTMLRLLGDRTRLMILAMLEEGELSVSTIAERLNRPLPMVSQHLAKLRAAGLVVVRKEGTSSLYSQPDEHLTRLIVNALHFSEHRFNPTPLHHRG